jgi:hypothetical protein
LDAPPKNLSLSIAPVEQNCEGSSAHQNISGMAEKWCFANRPAEKIDQPASKDETQFGFLAQRPVLKAIPSQVLLQPASGKGHPGARAVTTQPKASQRMYRLCISALLAGTIGLVGGTQAVGEQMCRPSLAFKEVRFSEMLPPTRERKWTAVVSVDASRCAMNSTGSFEIIFARQKENALDIEFSEKFTWSPPSVKVAIDFWADEAADRYWITNVSTCSCAR